MFQTITRWLTRKATPPTLVYDPPRKDWIDVLEQLRQAEEDVLAYATRPELPAVVKERVVAAADRIKVGRVHDLMRTLRTPVASSAYTPCCSHVTEALAARHSQTTTSV